jgi:hypothetical protein
MNLGAAAFWIFVAVVVIVVNWRNKHRDLMRHETIRLLIEKNQKLDEAQLAQLLNPPPAASAEWIYGPKPKPGDGYRGLRISGTLLIFLALGLAIVCAWNGVQFGLHDKSVSGLVVWVPLAAMLGVGLFVASRFAARPPSDENKDKRNL